MDMDQHVDIEALDDAGPSGSGLNGLNGWTANADANTQGHAQAPTLAEAPSPAMENRLVHTVERMTMDANEDVSVEELERELPVVWDEMVPLGELVSRVAQDLYTQLGELAETCVCGCIQYQRIEYSIDMMLHVPQDAGDERRGT
jgi:hypothetical protein